MKYFCLIALLLTSQVVLAQEQRTLNPNYVNPNLQRSAKALEESKNPSSQNSYLTSFS